ncbi:MAG: pitrilysin family protein [Eubacteriales bacterium]|nr:pitrilysin family protein [Eubacteriales bacterium]
MKMRRLAVIGNTGIYGIRSGRFKTNTIHVFLQDVLSGERAALNSLIPAILKAGTAGYPEMKDISMRLEELYGSAFSCGTHKKGERQIISFHIDFVSDRFINSGGHLFEDCFSLLSAIITDPFLENGFFRPKHVEREIENHKSLIESRINDKAGYAAERCIEEMCINEPYGIMETGKTEDLEGINAKSLFEHYRKAVAGCPADIFVTGDISDKRILEACRILFSGIDRSGVTKIPFADEYRGKPVPKEICEDMKLTQGKLCMGFRTGITGEDSRYYALSFCNAIFGGGGCLHSKLFRNVREENSLAYYIYSRIDRFKGIMTVNSGIEISDKEKASAIILKQLDDMKAGNISDYEYEATLKTILTSLKAMSDSPGGLVEHWLGQSITGTSDSPVDAAAKFRSVTKDDIIEAAGNIELDTVFFLK